MFTLIINCKQREWVAGQKILTCTNASHAHWVWRAFLALLLGMHFLLTVIFRLFLPLSKKSVENVLFQILPQHHLAQLFHYLYDFCNACMFLYVMHARSNFSMHHITCAYNSIFTLYMAHCQVLYYTYNFCYFYMSFHRLELDLKWAFILCWCW